VVSVDLRFGLQSSAEFQDCGASFIDVVPGCLEVPGVPGVCNFVVSAGMAQQQRDFAVGIAAEGGGKALI
jgi:hypothetical protein